MAVDWYAAFKDIPWSKASSVAPALAEQAKKLWARVASRDKTPSASGTPLRQAEAGAEAFSALEVRCHALEARTARLDEETAASFEVVQAIAEQHSELVRAVDVLLARTRLLLRVCVLLGVAVIALLILFAARA